MVIIIFLIFSLDGTNFFCLCSSITFLHFPHCSSIPFTCLSILPDNDADIFVVTLLTSYCNLFALILSPMIMTTLYTFTNRFFQKLMTLFDGRIV